MGWHRQRGVVSVRKGGGGSRFLREGKRAAGEVTGARWWGVGGSQGLPAWRGRCRERGGRGSGGGCVGTPARGVRAAGLT
jgi:hypothetical protein